MIQLRNIVPLRGHQIDYADTERLKAKLARLRRERDPFWLTGAELDEILLWKFVKLTPRQQELRAANSDELIRAVTSLALSLTHPDKDYELELRLKTLCMLRGVSLLVASAILALAFPKKYAVIDFRVWRQLFGEQKYTFSVSDYKRYMHVMHRLAKELGWPVQEVDHAIWECDRRRSERKTTNVRKRGR